MKRVLLGMLLCFSCAADAEGQAQKLLSGAVHCLIVKNFLSLSEAGKRTFGYLLDEKSYPGKKLLYVVQYENSLRPDGFVFALFVTDQSRRQDFNIQNNARFTLSVGLDGGVSFVDPPLGGTWTQAHLVSAIKQIEKQRRFTISASDLISDDSSVNCAAYTDSHP